MSTLLLAIIIGAAFGFALDRVGATNPGHIVGMLRLSRLQLAKTILFAIGFASTLFFGAMLLGLIDAGNMSVKTAYLGVFVGGALLGIGFAVAGYCPGTSLAAMATGRKDAIFFALGGLLGAAAYMVTYPSVKASGLLDPIAGGKTTLGAIPGTDYPALIPGLSGELVGVVMGLVFMALAWALPNRLTSEPVGNPQPAE